MKWLLSLLIRILRRCFYNTPVKHWRITAFLYACVGRLLIGTEPYPIIQFDGAKLKTNGEDAIVTAALINGNYEPYTLRIFYALLRETLEKRGIPSPVFVDIGANIGVFAITAAALDPGLKVFAFEPDPTSYRLLQDNIELNKLGNVTVVNAAVGQEGGMASLDVSSTNAGMHSIYGTGTRRLEVPLVSLDDFFSAQNLTPRLFKADVEGYEPLVLRGMKNLLQNSPLQIILEFNPDHLRRGGKEPGEFLQELTLQFDGIYCLDEIEQSVIPYDSGNSLLAQKIQSVGCNLLLIKGHSPKCLK